MQSQDITWETWAEEADRLGVRLETIAVLTGYSFASVYRFANGSRKPKDRDAWVAKVAGILRARALEAERQGVA